MNVNWVRIQNKYDNLCLICGKIVKRREWVDWLTDNGIRHVDCGEIFDEAELLQLKALGYFVRGKYEDGREFYKKAINLFSSIKIDPDKSRALMVVTDAEEIELDIPIPQDEDEHNEFKDSWEFEQEIDDLRRNKLFDAVKEKEQSSLQRIKSKQLDITKSVCAFLNAQGGNIWLGISDRREVIGLDGDYSSINNSNKRKFDVLTQKISNVFGKYLQKNYALEIHYIPHQTKTGKEILQIKIDALNQMDEPAYIHVEGKKIPYVRKHSSDMPLNDPEEWYHYRIKRFTNLKS